MGVNKVILLGRLGQDPELKHTPAGNTVCNFSLATSEKYKDKQGNEKEKTEWSKIVCWQRLAEICGEYLSKGRQVYIEGKLQTRSWDDKDGNKRYTTEILAEKIEFIGGKSENNSSGFNHDSPENEAIDRNNQNFTADDIPF